MTDDEVVDAIVLVEVEVSSCTFVCATPLPVSLAAARIHARTELADTRLPTTKPIGRSCVTGAVRSMTMRAETMSDRFPALSRALA